MHAPHGATGLLTAPEPPGPESRSPRRARRRRGLVAAIVAAAVVLLCANGAVAYYGNRVSHDEKVESVEPVR